MSASKVIVPGILPEHELLLHCARPRVDSETAARVRLRVQEGVDWAFLLRAAHRHGVLPLLFSQLNATCPEIVPEASLERLRHSFETITAHNFYIAEELCRVLHLFAAGAIPAIPFRGPVLAASAYGNLAHRAVTGLSFLVRKEHVLRTRDLLLAERYRPGYSLNRKQEAALLKFQYAWDFYRGDDCMRVSIHWQIDPWNSHSAVEMERLWHRLEPISLGGEKILTFPPEGFLLYLCSYLANEILELGLVHICDVARLLEAHQDMDWEWVINRAISLGGRRRLFLGLLAASDLLAAALPEHVAQKVREDPAVRLLVAQACGRLFPEAHAAQEFRTTCFFHLRARERLRDRIRFCLRLVATPSQEDWAVLALPATFSFIYYLLRPIRLIARRLDLYSPKRLAVYLPTPIEVAKGMLALAEVKETDIMYDLGCGDGRLVIMAAKRYGARGVGVDLDPERVAEANAIARKEGVGHLVTFAQQNVLEVDLSSATVVTLYLSQETNLLLRPKLQKQLRPGARIVSHGFEMGDWAPVKSELIAQVGKVTRVYMWRIANTGVASNASDHLAQVESP